MAYRYALDRTGTRERLVADLAAGESTTTELATKYGVTRQGLYSFTVRHAAEIETHRTNVAAALVDHWAAIKGLRIEALVEDLERLEGLLTGLLAPPDPEAPPADLADVVRLVGAKRQHLRAIAEELGQIPRSIEIKGSVEVATYRIEADISGI